MAGRQSEPDPAHRFAVYAAILLASAWHAGPAAASANTAEMCDDAGKHSLEISGSELKVLEPGRDIDGSGIEIGGSDNDPDALLPANYLSPRDEAALRELLEETTKTAPDSPVADTPRADGSEQPSIKARVPGVSDDDLARYKRQMYRRDI